MFAGFNLEIDKQFFQSQTKTFKEYQEIGEQHLSTQRASVEDTLTSYIKNSVIDGTKIQKEWFPEIKADIFLSHSSGDKELVNAIAGWIYDNFGLKCFIDSNVWGYAGKIADMLNTDYSNKRLDSDGGYLYNHKSCLKVSEHVNTMLNIALLKMIDKCECIFLINTDKSIHINSDSKNIDATYSPWIYSELACSKLVQKKPLYMYRGSMEILHSIYESQKVEDIEKSLTISYEVATQHLIKINQSDLKAWRGKYDLKYPFPLDLLYYDYFGDMVSEVRKCFKY